MSGKRLGFFGSPRWRANRLNAKTLYGFDLPIHHFRFFSKPHTTHGCFAGLSRAIAHGCLRGPHAGHYSRALARAIRGPFVSLSISEARTGNGGCPVSFCANPYNKALEPNLPPRISIYLVNVWQEAWVLRLATEASKSAQRQSVIRPRFSFARAK